MLKFNNINPVARAVGIMGAIAAVVGGVTFAALQSNTVALTPNTLTTGTATLAIGEPGNCGPASTNTTTAGFNNATLTPGDPVSVSFCLVNTGDVALDMFGIIPQDLSSSPAAAATNFKVDCEDIGSAEGTLAAWNSYQAFDNPLAVNNDVACTATATLSESYSGGGEAIPAFSVNFIGNEVAGV
jgi:hypothetical protein